MQLCIVNISATLSAYFNKKSVSEHVLKVTFFGILPGPNTNFSQLREHLLIVMLTDIIYIHSWRYGRGLLWRNFV